MGIRIKHRTQCLYCHEWFEPGHAFLQKTKGSWGCQCDRCFQKRNPCKAAGKHLRPVELNRGRHGHVWVCLECEKQLRGPSLPKEEIEILIAFVKHLTEKEFPNSIKNPERDKPANAEKEINNMKLEVAMLVGAESKQFLVDLTKQIDRMEALVAKGPAIKTAPAKTKNTAPVDADEETETSEDDEDFAPKKNAGKKAAAAAFDEDDEETGEAEETASDDDEGFMEAAPPKKTAAKPKKLTVDDINDACKARAAATGGKEGRAEVLALLKKHFKTTSVSEIKPEDYPKLIKVMAV